MWWKLNILAQTSIILSPLDIIIATLRNFPLLFFISIKHVPKLNSRKYLFNHVTAFIHIAHIPENLQFIFKVCKIQFWKSPQLFFILYLLFSTVILEEFIS